MKVTIITVHIYKLENQLHEPTVSLLENFSLYAVTVARWPAVIFTAKPGHCARHFSSLNMKIILFIIFPCDLFSQAKEFTTKKHAKNSTELMFDQL